MGPARIPPAQPKLALSLLNRSPTKPPCKSLLLFWASAKPAHPSPSLDPSPALPLSLFEPAQLTRPKPSLPLHFLFLWASPKPAQCPTESPSLSLSEPAQFPH